MTEALDRRFSLGRVFSRGWQIFTRNWITLSLLAMVFAVIPNALGGLIRINSDRYNPEDFGQSLRGVYGEELVINLIALVLTITVYNVAARHMEGRRAGFGEALAGAGRLFLPVLGLSIVTSIGYAIGALLLLVPLFILLVWWAVALPVRVIEKREVFPSLDRSRDLARGHFWIVLVAILAIYVVVFLLTFIGGGVFAFTPPFVSEVIGLPLVYALFGIALPALTASLYFELKHLKEGHGSAVAEVFS